MRCARSAPATVTGLLRRPASAAPGCCGASAGRPCVLCATRCARACAGLRLVHHASADRGSCARPQGRRHRGADRRRLAHHRRDRTAGSKRGQRLLIIGRQPHRPTPAEIARLHPEYRRRCFAAASISIARCNTLGNAIETRRLGRAARLSLADRRDVELSHAARAWLEIGHQFPGVALVAFPVVSDKLRAEPWWSSRGDRAAACCRISEIRLRPWCASG